MKRLTANGTMRPLRSRAHRDLSSEDRVKAAASMTVVAAVCIESIKEKEPGLSEEELISRARARFMFGRERRQA